MGGDLLVETLGGRALFQVVTAGLSGNDETGRHRQPEIGHLGQVGPFTTQQILEILISFGEVINELRHFLLLAARDVLYSSGLYRGGGSEDTDLGPGDATRTRFLRL